MRKQRHYFNRDGAEVSEAEALVGGILRHGYSIRVPTQFRDARAAFDSGTLACSDPDLTGISGSRPGWRVLDTSYGQAEKDRARLEHERYLNDAWRGDPASDIGKHDTDDACSRKKVQRYGPTGKSEGYWEEEDPDEAFDHRTLTVDALQARRDAAVAPARESMIAETANAWRRNK